MYTRVLFNIINCNLFLDLVMQLQWENSKKIMFRMGALYSFPL